MLLNAFLNVKCFSSLYRINQEQLQYLGHNVFELALLPSICRVVHHGDYGVIVFFILVIKEDQLSPQVSLFCCPQDLEYRTLKL